MTQPYTNIGFSGNIKQSLFLSDIYYGYVLRISSKNPYLPPDLGKAEMQFTLIFVLIKTFLHVLESCHLYFQFLIEKQREEEAKMKEQVAKKM